MSLFELSTMNSQERQSGFNSKRHATSPTSSEFTHTQKKYRINERLQHIAEDQPLLDKEEVLETVMTRVNSALQDAVENVEKVGGKEEDQGSLIAKVMTPFVTALATAITLRVAEVMNKVIKN